VSNHLVTVAEKLASTLLTVPLDDLKSVRNKTATLGDAEQQLLNNALGALPADGLPDPNQNQNIESREDRDASYS
jgi:hypothetical protein